MSLTRKVGSCSVTRFSLVFALLILAMPNIALAEQQFFVVETQLTDRQLQEDVAIRFSNGASCNLSVNLEKPTDKCLVRLQIPGSRYWITGELLQRNEDAKFWQPKTRTLADTTGKKGAYKLQTLPTELAGWQSAASVRQLIQSWNKLMKHFRQQFPDHASEAYPIISAGEKQSLSALDADALPPDYIELVTQFGLPQFENSDYEFRTANRLHSAWDVLTEVTGINETHLSVKHIEQLKQSRVFFNERDGEIVEYFVGGSPTCQQKTYRLWLAEIMVEDIVHDLSHDNCDTFQEFFSGKLAELYEYIEPTEADIVYQAQKKPIKLQLSYWAEDESSESIDYYLVLDEE